MKRKIMSLATAILMACTSAIAVEPSASDVPKEFKNLSAKSDTAELMNLSASESSLTNYFFSTHTGEINLDFHLVRSGDTANTKRVLKMYLYENDRLDSSTWEKKEINHSVTFYGDEISNPIMRFSNLNPNKFYYLEFANESSTDEDSRLGISGQIVLTK